MESLWEVSSHGQRNVRNLVLHNHQSNTVLIPTSFTVVTSSGRNDSFLSRQRFLVYRNYATEKTKSHAKLESFHHISEQTGVQRTSVN